MIKWKQNALIGNKNAPIGNKNAHIGNKPLPKMPLPKNGFCRFKATKMTKNEEKKGAWKQLSL
jgi:hypothetical protein